MSVKGPGNIFDLSPKWQRTLSSFGKLSHQKYIKDDKVLANLELRLKVFPRPLADLNA
jgi:hypothetical protein